MQLVSTRSAALAFGLPRYFTGKACVNGHTAERYSAGGCVECVEMRTVADRAAQPDKSRESCRRYHSRNRTAQNARCREYHAANKQNVNARQREYVQAHLSEYSARAAQRNAAKKQRSPAWADARRVKGMYAAAWLLTQVLGEPWHVDHVVPLQGDRVSGLHVYENLQLLRGAENVGKKNRYEVA